MSLQDNSSDNSPSKPRVTL